MLRTSISLALSLVLAPSVLAGQHPEFTMHTAHLPPDAPAPGEKSPTLAGLLSWLVWPGVGSYYGGNSGHGTRHLVVGLVSAGGAIALLATCDSDGFCDFDNDGTRLTAAIGLGAVFAANSIWSILTAVGDAEEHNRQLRSGNVAFRPALRELTTSSPGQRSAGLGLQFLEVRF